jgi:general stress protein YciG
MSERDKHGRFLKGSKAARESGRKGGKLSTGSFKKGEQRARDAGSKGGRHGGRKYRASLAAAKHAD